MKFILSLFLAGLLQSRPVAALAQSPDRPNLIIIYADDLGYGDLSCYGGTIPTPNIDRIGKQGIRFTDFYVASPVCTPSRYGLLTGSYPERSRHQLTTALMPGSRSYLDDSEKTLAQYLKPYGYATALIGKWHLGAKDSLDLPTRHGFDVFSGFMGGCIDFFTHVYGQMGPDWYVNGQRTSEKGYSTDLLTDHALSFIDQARSDAKPFFIFLTYNAPHYGKTDPKQVPDYTVSLSESTYQGYGLINSLQAPPEYIRRFAHLKDPYRRAYAAMVSSLDDNVGRLLAKLQKEGLEENTMLWFISDNGGYSKSYFGHADNGGLRGEKAELSEGGIRVPGLVCWKGRIQPGQENRSPVCNVDLLPTLGGLIGFKPDLPPSRIDGVDIREVLFRRKTVSRTLFWKYNKQTALRRDEWKLVNGTDLYNLNTDWKETTNLAAQHPKKVAELQQAFDRIQQSITVP